MKTACLSKEAHSTDKWISEAECVIDRGKRIEDYITVPC